MGCGKHIVAFLFKYNKCSYLQYQPQLVSTFHVFLVVHPVEFDNIGVVRKSFEDVVLRFDLLIDILQNKDKYQLKDIFCHLQSPVFCTFINRISIL